MKKFAITLLAMATALAITPATMATSGGKMKKFSLALLKQSNCLAFAAFALLAALALPMAHATSYGPLTVTVWTGTFNSGVSDLAQLPVPASSPTWTFTYSGPLDFTNNNPQGGSNTFADFFNSNSSYISGLSSIAEANLLSSPMSTIGETGDAINTYMDFSGSYSGGGPVTISSDDGSCFYAGSSPVQVPGLCNPNPQTDTPATGSLSAGVNVPFNLIYVESNGSPADLQATGLVPTPEPSSLFLLGTGLLGLAFLIFRKTAKQSSNLVLKS